jgi:hypothetical protein
VNPVRIGEEMVEEGQQRVLREVRLRILLECGNFVAAAQLV